MRSLSSISVDSPFTEMMRSMALKVPFGSSCAAPAVRSCLKLSRRFLEDGSVGHIYRMQYRIVCNYDI